jgi:hypothetical protein
LRGLHGLTCDNLVGATLIKADGRVVDADRELLWGLRGGGGNFGVVTSFEFELYPLGQVVAGPLEVPQSKEFLAFYREFVETLPDGFSADLVMKTRSDGVAVFTILGFFAGEPRVADRVLEPLRVRFHPTEAFAPRSYVESQRIYDAGSPWGQRNYWKSNGMAELSDDAIDVLLERFRQIPSPLCMVGLEFLHGAVHRVDPGMNAVGFKRAKFDLLIESKWLDPAEDDANVAWARETWNAIQPYVAGPAYTNYLVSEPQERVRSAYGEAVYERLVRLKDRYDPANLFRFNQNVRPSAEVR